MELLNYLSYVNVLAFLLFLVVAFFLGYEIYLFKKETNREKKLKKIPDFKIEKNNYLQLKINQPVVIEKKEKKIYKKNNFFAILTLGFFLIFIFVFLIFDFLNKTQVKHTKAFTPQMKIIPAFSFGIKIYDKNWAEINENNSFKLKEGDKIFIGLMTIDGADIDKARIRVNRSVWLPSDETTRFLPDKKIFYIEYIISSESSELKIEAQLHSKTQGWLGN